MNTVATPFGVLVHFRAECSVDSVVIVGGIIAAKLFTSSTDTVVCIVKVTVLHLTSGTVRVDPTFGLRHTCLCFAKHFARVFRVFGNLLQPVPDNVRIELFSAATNLIGKLQYRCPSDVVTLQKAKSANYVNVLLLCVHLLYV